MKRGEMVRRTTIEKAILSLEKVVADGKEMFTVAGETGNNLTYFYDGYEVAIKHLRKELSMEKVPE